ncbi:PglZ domain-containing protein [uncultured Thiocystis sp.]|jgi:hypothetical protein|uniref:PglZ domain-containing protein n=1 Tax=uncultured Thiocystis sp. TaxID=1202134 RepID=UPI0025F53B3A|nr:PglZ domain-containing protein [uncultured Thiocystis sp.]
MNVSQHVDALIVDRLRERRVLVWYDPDRVFHALFEAFDHQPLVKVDASLSMLHARRAADQAWRALFGVDASGPPQSSLLIYLPAERGTTEESRRADLFEPFALSGTSFGDAESERLPSIARQVLAGREADVDRLFASGVPTIPQLDALAEGTRYPLLREALGTEVPGRVAIRLLCGSVDALAHLESAPGLLAELRRLLADSYGFDQDVAIPFGVLGSALAQWLLFSEFVFDLPGASPATVTHVPHADARFRRPIEDLCHDLRTSSEHRDRYRELAAEVERRLGLSGLGDTADACGDRDTFPFADRAALRRLQQGALTGELGAARGLIQVRRSSVWRSQPECDQLWRLAERCLDLLEAGVAWETRRVGADRPVTDHVRAYCAEGDGLWRLDQAQRLVEQAASLLVDRDRLAPLLDHVRQAYRRWLGVAQDHFLESVARSGWPADGFVRQTQAWTRYAAGPISDGRRTAWFLVDALRFEMGRELADRLRAEGHVQVEPACGVVPAATPFGMAALLPGAEVGLGYGEHDGGLVPLIAGKPVVTAEDRRAVFRAAYGDRFRSLRLGELLTASTAQLRGRIGAADVLAVFSTEIDDLGEHNDPLLARRYISEVVADLLAAANRLTQLGFERLVFVADHGFMLLPEILPGDRCPEPAGHWLLSSRRSLLGTLGARSDRVLAIGAATMGIQGPVDQVCVPRGVKVFRAGSPYFHEGLSLQECVVPIVVLDAVRRQPAGEVEAHVDIHYRSNRFTTRIFSVRVSYTSLLSPELAVRVQAFAPGTTRIVGEAADCEARDPHTGLVLLKANEQVQVPIALESDFDGDAVDIRVIDASTPGRSFASLVLRNATLD